MTTDDNSLADARHFLRYAMAAVERAKREQPASRAAQMEAMLRRWARDQVVLGMVQHESEPPEDAA